MLRKTTTDYKKVGAGWRQKLLAKIRRLP